MAHPNEDLVRRGYQAFQQQDLDTLNEVFADDITWKSLGNTPLSGEFHGKQEVFGLFARIPELTDSFSMDIHDVLANEDHAVGLVKVQIGRGSNRMEGNAVHIYHVDDGKVTSAWIVQEDQAAWEDFWAD